MNPKYTVNLKYTFYKLDFGTPKMGETRIINPILKSSKYDTPVYMTNTTNGEMYIVGSWKDPHWKHYPADMWPSVRHMFPWDDAATNYLPPGIRTAVAQYKIPTNFPQRVDEGRVNRALFAVYVPTVGTDSAIYAQLLNKHFNDIDRLRPWESLPEIVRKPPPVRKYDVNRYISNVLNQMASDKKEQESKSWFAYRTAAKAIYDLEYEITPGNLNELKKIKGIGKVMFDVIKSILPEAMRTTASVLD
jgi:hypothetical protein